jgi:hypothetical protein
MPEKRSNIPFFGAIGMLVGAGLGVLSHSIPQGVGAGLAIGVGVGALRERMIRAQGKSR